jgi:hypothetical protein
MSTLEVNKITPQGVATEVTLGDSGDTFTIPSGVTLDGSSATLTGFATTNGITSADMWVLTSGANYTGSQGTFITSNLARMTDSGYVGAGVSQSSGVFTFPSNGIWYVSSQAQLISYPAEMAYGGILIQVDSGDGSYSTRAENYIYLPNVGSPVSAHMTAFTSILLNVTDYTSWGVKFRLATNNSVFLNASGTNMRTGFVFIRLGDAT